MIEEKFLKCIADNNRRRILNSLGGGERCVNDIIELTGLEQTLVSFHLKELRNCGLVRSRREGKKIMYRVSDPEIMDVLVSIRDLSSRIKELSCGGECE